LTILLFEYAQLLNVKIIYSRFFNKFVQTY